MIAMLSGCARIAGVALACGTVDMCRCIVGAAHQLDGHTKDVVADTNAPGGALLIDESLKDVRLEDATMVMHRFEAAFAIEGITLLALAARRTVPALAALGLQHNLAHIGGTQQRVVDRVHRVATIVLEAVCLAQHMIVELVIVTYVAHIFAIRILSGNCWLR